MKKVGNFNLTNATKGKLPRLPFSLMKESVLGKRYELSLVFTDTKFMQKLNRAYRGKNRPTDILSFPLSHQNGEIIICVAEACKEARKFGRLLPNFLAFLFIHGLVHLKGFRHGGKMERQELKFRKRFGV